MVRKRNIAMGVAIAWLGLAGVPSARAGGDGSSAEPAPAVRLLSVKEGRAIVHAAFELQSPARDERDCSHLIHAIYQRAGFDYPYQNSYDLYAGADGFARVKSPRAGDLIVWPGHVGIVVNPAQHSFYSLVRTGLEEQDYEGAYWRSRGTPRFYRYRLDGRAESVATRHEAEAAEPAEAEAEPAANEVATEPASESPRGGAAAPAIPSSIVITGAKKLPSRDDVAASVAELTAAEANVFATEEALKIQVPVDVVEQISVARVEIKRDHGWVYLQIRSAGTITGGAFQAARREESVRWALRRTKTNWEAVMPTDQAYVQQSVAIRNLSAQLAHLTASDTARDAKILQQESRIASLLAALLAAH